MFKTKNNPSLNNLSKIIWEYSRSKIVIVGIGNVLKGDDGFGPILISRLKNKLKAVCLNAATVPENYIGSITKEKPELILLADAVNSTDTAPGELALYGAENIGRVNSVSTHNTNLSLFLSLLSLDCPAKIYLIGFNPVNLDFESTLSPEGERAIFGLEKLFLEILSNR